jgi:hypothetical protein
VQAYTGSFICAALRKIHRAEFLALLIQLCYIHSKLSPFWQPSVSLQLKIYQRWRKMTVNASRQVHDTGRDQVLPVSKVLAAIIVPILTAAFIMLFLFPGHSGLLFAWPVNPTMSAMMLGGTYLGGAYFFARAVKAKEWHTVSLGFLPVSTFAGILGIATLLHWDRFTQGHISFILWVFLYFTLPFVIPVIWYINQRAAGAGPAQPSMSRLLRTSLGGIGVVMTLASLVLLVMPEVMIPAWPWTLTPLTARVTSAMFALPGLVGIGVALDGRWSSAKIIFQAQVVAIGLIFLAMLFAAGDIQWSHWGIWLFISGLLLTLALIGWAALEARQAER